MARVPESLRLLSFRNSATFLASLSLDSKLAPAGWLQPVGLPQTKISALGHLWLVWLQSFKNSGNDALLSFRDSLSNFLSVKVDGIRLAPNFDFDRIWVGLILKIRKPRACDD